VLTSFAALTLVTGLVDAASYLRLGHVFTANMTGNIVFIGFGIGGAKGFSIIASLEALVGFLLGATLGGRIITPGATLRRARRALACEIGLLGAAALVTLAGSASHAGIRAGIIGLLGAAMGLQNAAIRKLGVADMATTVLTLTLTGIAADSSLAGGHNIHFTRRGASVALMLLGALVGAALSRAGLGWPIVAAIAAVGVAMALMWRADEERSVVASPGRK
jgi:uncharacterized membrane protein YoaK (UPF0700 family)